MDYIIKFDNREKELIKLLNLKGYDINTENLDLGDIQFIDSETKEIIIIIERKTLHDLSCSIKDGRYKEQKERMIYSLKKSVRKIVLIEGNDFDVFQFPINTLHSVIINTMIRDNIHIHITKDINETLEFIENTIVNLAKYYDDLKKEIVLNEEKNCKNIYNCKTNKKENLNEILCFRNMLTQIPGISTNMASIFSEKYKNMENFIYSLKKICNDDKNKIIELLSNEKYGTRRIGEKIAQKIIFFIFENDQKFIQINKEKKKTPYKSIFSEK